MFLLLVGRTKSVSNSDTFLRLNQEQVPQTLISLWI